MSSKYSLIVILLTPMAFSACVPHEIKPSAEPQVFTVSLTANPGQNRLDLPGNQGCTGGGNNNLGCVRFDRGNTGYIRFEIMNGPKDRTCSGGPPLPQWVITEVKLSAAGNLQTEKGEFSPAVVTPSLLASFPQTNSLTGVAYQATKEFATSSAVLIDMNEEAGDVYYQVSASNCAGSKLLVTDPRVQNTGK